MCNHLELPAVYIRVEKASSVPISRQIADQIRAQCLNRTLKPGDRLPSVRQLARELAVNQNTILRVYERLTGDGMLERRHGDGTYVADKPPTWRLATQRKRFAEEVAQLARRGRMLGLDDDEMHTMVQDALDQMPAKEKSSS
jgi:GntR family transcriptional regulator